MLWSCHVCQLASGASLVFLAHGSGHGLVACRKGLGQVWAEGKKDLPKKSANTVHVMVMTLYGIEKSGVGHWSKTESANSTTNTSALGLFWAGGGERSDAAHPIPSFACSSLRGACQHIMDARNSPPTVLHHNAMSGACSSLCSHARLAHPLKPMAATCHLLAPQASPLCRRPHGWRQRDDRKRHHTCERLHIPPPPPPR